MKIRYIVICAFLVLLIGSFLERFKEARKESWREAKKEMVKILQERTRVCGNILTDKEFQAQDMTVWQIQEFLDKHFSVLAWTKVGYKKASSIIFEAARDSGISPKVLLVTLQKEQGLITRKSAPDAVLAHAMGFHEPSDFESQVRDAARQFRRYLNYPERFPIQAWEINRLFDGIVRPVNAATAALYNYTPWLGERCGGKPGIGGNGLFLTLWINFFGHEPHD